MKKSFLAGFIILLPIALSIYLLLWLLDLFSTPFLGLIEQILINYEIRAGETLHLHAYVLAIVSRVIALICMLSLIFLLGFLGNRFFFVTLVQRTQKILLKIPVIRSVFSFTKEASVNFFSSDKKVFTQTVLLPFPSEKSYALALAIGETPGPVQERLPALAHPFFVPTAPQPTSGFILFSPKESAFPLPLTTEEAFAFLLSCGTSFPKEMHTKPPSPSCDTESK